MNSPTIWILAPGSIAVLSWFLRKHRIPTALITAVTALMLALTAWVTPISRPTNLGLTILEIPDTLNILGRRFVLFDNDRAFLVLIYALCAIWIFVSAFLEVHRSFPVLALGITVLSVAALAVEPFLFAALLIEIIVLISIPLLSPPGSRPSPSVSRYLVYQSLAMPLILIAGWVARGVEANPADEKLLLQAVALLTLGFALWLAVFPFHSWMPQLTSEIHPYVTGFLLSVLPLMTLLLSLDFLNTYAWLRDFPLLSPALRITGALMVVIGGIAVLFQQDLGKTLGYALIVENGFSLLALSLANRAGVEILVTSFLPRLLGIGVWALSLKIVAKHLDNFSFDQTRGLMLRLPFASSGLLFSFLTLAGLPLLPNFVPRLGLLETLSGQSLAVTAMVLLGSLFFFGGGLRVLSLMLDRKTPPRNSPQVETESPEWTMSETPVEAVLMTASVGVLFLSGSLPAWFLSGFLWLLRAFPRLW